MKRAPLTLRPNRFLLVACLFAAAGGLLAQSGDPKAWVEMLGNSSLEGTYTAIALSNENGVVTGVFPSGGWPLSWWDNSLSIGGAHTVTTYAEEKNGTVAGSALKVTTALQNGFTTGAGFQIIQSGGGGFPGIAGQTYRAKVWLKASAATNISFYVQRPASPWPVRASVNCAVTTVWQQFTFDYTADRTERLQLVLTGNNQAPNTVWIDEVSLARLGSGFTWFVAPGGDDSNPGTFALPYQTLETALKSVLPGDTLYLRAGTYREQLTPRRSGTATAPITIVAYPGETATLSGCDVVAGPWTSTTNGVHTAAVGWDLGEGYNQVFIDGEMQHEARYPNHGPGDLLHPATVDVTVSDQHTVTSPTFLALGNLTGARFLGGIGPCWTWQTAVISGKNGNTITLDPATESVWWWPNYEKRSSDAGRGFVYGKLDLLDADGEWFLQTNSTAPHTLHLRIAGGANPGTHLVEQKRRNWCVSVGDMNYITVRGLRLRAGAVLLRGMGNVLENCEARYFSHFLTFPYAGGPNGGRGEGSGVYMDGVGNIVRGCTIYDTAGSGVTTFGRNHLITRNHIYNINYSGTCSAPISLEPEGESQVVTFNTAHDSGRDILRPNAPGSTVMFNDFFGNAMLTKDNGVVYSVASNARTASGDRTRIAYNWIQFVNSESGVYLDNGSRNYQVDHNVIWSVGSYLDTEGINMNSPTEGHEVHHNTLYDAGSYNRSTYSAFPIDWLGSYWNVGNNHQVYRAFNNLVLTDASVFLENPAQRDFRPRAGSLAVDPSKVTNTIRWSTNDGFTGVPAGFTLKLMSRNLLFTYEEQAGQGVVLPGINDGYLGRTPDSGAYEFGGPYWKPGVDGWAVESAALQPGTPTGIGDTSARIQGTLISAGTTPTTVVAYWGTEDSGTNTAGWKNQTVVGTYTGSFIGLSQAIANLTPGTPYVVRFRATNAASDVWSQPISFKTTGQTPLSITTAPAPQAVISGQTATLSVTAAGIPPFTYVWAKDGVAIPGATTAILTIANTRPTDAGSYAVTVTNSAGSVTSTAASLSVAFSRLVNLSILTSLDSAGDSFTMGYVVGGAGTSGPKPLVIRAAGPSLGAFGISGTLDDPKIELFAGGTIVSENDNWGGSATLASGMSAVGAFAYMGPTSRDAAVALSVASGENSVKVSGAGTGSVIAEIYDATPVDYFTGTTPRLINVSVLKPLGNGFTAGFTVGGSGAKNVLVRAIGPTLGTAFGVAGFAGDPQLTLSSGQTAVASNDNWGGVSTLASAFSSVGAFALPATSRDAAVVASLNPGNYTVQVSGVAGATGMILVEIYELP